MNTYMTKNIYTQEQVISEITLNLLEDTGLYKINYYTGGLMRFGKNATCEFFKNDCNVNKTASEIHGNQTTIRNSKFLNEFCSGQTKTTCSSGRLSRGLCFNEKSTSQMVDKTQYNRGWENYGNKYSDYCPISIGEKEVDIDPKYSFIGNCKIGKTENYGNRAFYYWLESHNPSLIDNNLSLLIL